ncbi:MAG: hypothetical protein ACOWYE_14950 [Desulfatiglandales bacterium]
MKPFIFRLLLGTVLLFCMASCTHGPIENPTDKGPMITDATEQGGQLPVETVQQASDHHGGSMISETGHVADEGVPLAREESIGRGITVVLGPVNAERLEGGDGASKDAGQRIREVISRRLTASGRITLLDAPEERFIDDSPRPDLARKGVKHVIKGIASCGSDKDEVTVFLRAVDTMTGRVAMVASARSRSRDAAADEATGRLLTKMAGGE